MREATEKASKMVGRDGGRHSCGGVTKLISREAARFLLPVAVLPVVVVGVDALRAESMCAPAYSCESWQTQPPGHVEDEPAEQHATGPAPSWAVASVTASMTATMTLSSFRSRMAKP